MCTCPSDENAEQAPGRGRVGRDTSGMARGWLPITARVYYAGRCGRAGAFRGDRLSVGAASSTRRSTPLRSVS
eukprot:4869475-Prymnesium_polylepis.1